MRSKLEKWRRDLDKKAKRELAKTINSTHLFEGPEPGWAEEPNPFEPRVKDIISTDESLLITERKGIYDLQVDLDIPKPTEVVSTNGTLDVTQTDNIVDLAIDMTKIDIPDPIETTISSDDGSINVDKVGYNYNISVDKQDVEAIDIKSADTTVKVTKKDGEVDLSVDKSLQLVKKAAEDYTDSNVYNVQQEVDLLSELHDADVSELNIRIYSLDSDIQEVSNNQPPLTRLTSGDDSVEITNIGTNNFDLRVAQEQGGGSKFKQEPIVFMNTTGYFVPQSEADKLDNKVKIKVNTRFQDTSELSLHSDILEVFLIDDELKKIPGTHMYAVFVRSRGSDLFFEIQLEEGQSIDFTKNYSVKYILNYFEGDSPYDPLVRFAAIPFWQPLELDKHIKAGTDLTISSLHVRDGDPIEYIPD